MSQVDARVGTKVLLADCQHADRLELARYFRRQGFQPLSAATLREAKELTLEHRPDFAVVAYFLDGHAALPLLQLLLSMRETPRVVVTAQFASAHAVISSFRVGVFDFHEKPISVEKLYQAIIGNHLELSAPPEHCSLKQLEREYISRILCFTEGNVTAAAKILGVHRQSLQRKLRNGFPRASKELPVLAESQRVRESESQRVRESESQRVRESESQRVRESESQRVRELA